MGKKSEKKSAKKATSAKIANVEKIENVENVEKTRRVITLARAENFAKLLTGRKHSDIINAIVANVGAIEKNENFAKLNFSDSDKGNYLYSMQDLTTGWFADEKTGAKMLLFIVANVVENSGIKRAKRVYITDENAKKVVYGDSLTTITNRIKTLIKNSK